MNADNDDTVGGGIPTSPATRAPPVIGGRYNVLRLIARGGMASVLLAEHIALHRLVALKILHPPPSAEPEDEESFRRRFQLEAETLASLDHPNIVTIHDYGQTEDGRVYLAMEYIDGPRFTDLVARGPLEPDRAIRLILQVCAALRYAHKRGVVHRDLKPSNLLTSPDAEGHERVKVVDFGLVKVGEIDQSLTREGVVLGSPHCMAPEQVQGLAVDHRADIYAVGVLLFRALTGHYPFHGSTSTATMLAHLSEPLPTFARIAPELRISPRVEGIVRRCLARKPEERYPDAASLAVELSQAIGAQPEPDSTVSLVEPPALAAADPPRSSVPWLTLAGVAVMLLVVVSAVLFVGVLLKTDDPGAAVAAVPAALPPAAEAAPAPATGTGVELQPAAPAVEAQAEPAPAPPEAAPARPTPAPPRVAPRPARVAQPPAEPEAPSEPTTNPEGYMPVPDDLK